MTATFSPAIRNLALDLAMAWGKNWMKPIQSRLTKAAPELGSDQLEALNALCQQTIKTAWRTMESLTRMENKVPRFPSLAEFRAGLGPDFDWIAEAQLSRLHSQSAYYAMK